MNGITYNDFQEYRKPLNLNFCGQCGLELRGKQKDLCTLCLDEAMSFCECGGYKLENLDVCEECL